MRWYQHSLATWSRRGSGPGWWRCLRWSPAPGRSWSRGRESQHRRRCKEAPGRRWPGSASDRSERKSCTRTAGVPADEQRLLRGSSCHSPSPLSCWETPAASAQTLRSPKPTEVNTRTNTSQNNVWNLCSKHPAYFAYLLIDLLLCVINIAPTWQVSRERVTTRSRDRRPIVLTALQQAVKAPQVRVAQLKHSWRKDLKTFR